MNYKTSNNIRTIIGIIVRGAAFFMFPAIFSSAFSGLKYICTQVGAGQMIELTTFLVTLIALIAFTTIFGRFFCGFFCAFGTYSDFLYTIATFVRKSFRKKFKIKKEIISLPKKLSNIFRYGKYVVLVVVLAMCVLQKTDDIARLSPWVPFSRLQSLMPLGTEGSIINVILLVLISIGMLFVPRFFCRFLCPLGAIFALLPHLPISVLTRDKSSCAKGCSLCEKNCPAELTLADKNSEERVNMGECFSCGKCVYKCPKQNASATINKAGIKGYILMIVKALILFALCYYLEIRG